MLAFQMDVRNILTGTLSRSTKPVHALRADLAKDDPEEPPSVLAAFMIHLLESAMSCPSLTTAVSASERTVISCTSSRQVEAVSYGTAKAREVSFEIECNGLPVGGRSCTDLFSCVKTSFGKGAFRGEVFESESGKTRVRRTSCWAS